MKIWGIVRNAANLILARYSDGDLKTPNLTQQGNVPVESILISPNGLVPASADVDDNLIAGGQTLALGIAENYVYSSLAIDWIRMQALSDSSDGQAASPSGMLGTVARLQGWNGATFDRIKARGNNADGQAADTAGRFSVNATPLLYNGTTFDRERGNVQGVALASAVRGASTNSPDIINYNAKGAVFFLDVTAVPGVQTITAQIQFKDPVSGNYISVPGNAGAGTSLGFGAKTSAISATGTYMFMVGGNNADFYQCLLVRTLRVAVTHSGAGNFTYSLGYSLLA